MDPHAPAVWLYLGHQAVLLVCMCVGGGLPRAWKRDQNAWLDSALCTTSHGWEGFREEQVCSASPSGLDKWSRREFEEGFSLGWAEDWKDVGSASETVWEWKRHRITCEEAIAPRPHTCASPHSSPN